MGPLVEVRGVSEFPVFNLHPEASLHGDNWWRAEPLLSERTVKTAARVVDTSTCLIYDTSVK